MLVDICGELYDCKGKTFTNERVGGFLIYQLSGVGESQTGNCAVFL